MDIYLNPDFSVCKSNMASLGCIKCRGSIGTGLRIALRGLVLSFGYLCVVAIPYLKLSNCSQGDFKVTSELLFPSLSFI